MGRFTYVGVVHLIRCLWNTRDRSSPGMHPRLHYTRKILFWVRLFCGDLLLSTREVPGLRNKGGAAWHPVEEEEKCRTVKMSTRISDGLGACW